jgi:hypothetical protein
MKKILILTFFLLLTPLSAPPSLNALEVMNVWRHSQIAGKNSVFADIALPPFAFRDFEFGFLPLDVRIECLPPLPLPFSLGVFFATPDPNFKSFGLRLAYHFDLLDSLTDFYVLYSFDFGFLRNGILEKYNDAPVEIRRYDFRIGVRRFFGTWFGLAAETGFKFESVILMLSIKIN